MRGVQLIATETLVAKLQNLLRTCNPRQIMAHSLVPDEHSSGPKRRQGSIAKVGNSAAHARGGDLALPAQPAREPDHRYQAGPLPEAVTEIA